MLEDERFYCETDQSVWEKLKNEVQDLNLKLKNEKTRYRKHLNLVGKNKNYQVKRTLQNELTPLTRAKKLGHLY